MSESEWTDYSRIDTVGDLIRALSFWCPDTPVEFTNSEDEEGRDIIQTDYSHGSLTFLLEG